MARKSPKLNLQTSKVADGASPARSVYELVGIPTTSYRHKTLASYTKMINGLNMIELHDHAYDLGIPTHPDRHTLIDRLERHFIQENAKFSPAIDQPQSAINEDLREQAERITARGR